MILKEGTRVALAMRRGVVMQSSESAFELKLDGSGELVWIEFRENWLEESMEVPEPKTLLDRIQRAINATSSENGSDTPDFILAKFLTECLDAFHKATQYRDEWNGVNGDSEP